MEFDQFCQTHIEVWHKHFKRLYTSIHKKEVNLQTGLLLYPTMVLYTETEDHYLAELFGAVTKYNNIIPRRHVESSTARYLYQYAALEENPMFIMNARNNSFKFLLLSRDIDKSRVKERFGLDLSDMYPSQLSMTKEGGSLIAFGPEFQSCYLDNCLLVNTYQQIYRMKSILNLTVISKTMSLPDFIQDMQYYHSWPVQNTGELHGVYYIPTSSAWAYIMSGQFANLFLVPGLREPNIGQFIHRNPNFIKYALDCVDFLYEQPLEWKEGNSNLDEKYIQPDLLLKLANDNWDICDLKKPLLERARIVKGQHSRRRFIDYVEEGIAQLANYEDYFKFKKNADYARNKYRVSVSNPKLILIIGNYENVEPSEIKEAERMLKPNYAIIDYDSLNTSFLLRVYPRDN